MTETGGCDLCGLGLRDEPFTTRAAGKMYRFCCNGCRQVFWMLFESVDAVEPEKFKETEVFAVCREIGLIPAPDEGPDRQPSEIPSAYNPFSSRDDARADTDSSVGHRLHLDLAIEGMWCPACAWVIEAALKKTPGIETARCNFATDRLACTYDPTRLSPDRIDRVLARLGYSGAVPGDRKERQQHHREFIRLAVAVFLTMNVMMLSFALYFGFFSDLPAGAVGKISWPIFAMTSVVIFYGGKPIYQKASRGLTQAAFGMETLISIGAFTAYFYSCYNLLAGSIHLYFDTSCMLVTLVLVGKKLEQGAKKGIRSQLDAFFALKPKKARICGDGFPEGRFVDAACLKRGDIVSVKASEAIPADGIVLEGVGAVDESSLTGEPRPVQKESGHRVTSGTRLLEGAFTVKAEKVGEASTIGQMIRVMQRALGQKTPLEGRTDRLLRWFVPGVLMLSLGVGVVGLAAGWELQRAIVRSVTVMVIACPCALGIAIPIARVAGIAVATRAGILIHEASAFDRIESIDTVVWDKTGTLTAGNWQLREIQTIGPFKKKQALSIAAALETNSVHYIGAEIMRHARENPVPRVSLEQIVHHPDGVSGMLGADEVRIGSQQFVTGGLDPAAETRAGNASSSVLESIVYLSFGGRMCARFVFGDNLKPGASRTVEMLKKSGYRVALISGDSQAATDAVGRLLGIEQAYGDRKPPDKATLIKSWQEAGEAVAMVGDGINDAPALVQSDLAVAAGSGGHLGHGAADVTLMQGKPEQIRDLFSLAGQVNRTIRQNLFFSFGYNFIGIPLAIGGVLTPLVAVSAMVMSSLSVIGNAVLLVRRQRRIYESFLTGR